MKWLTLGKNKFTSIVPCIKARAVDRKPFQIAPASASWINPFPAQSSPLVNPTLFASATMTSDPSSILFATASRLSPIEAQYGAGQADTNEMQRLATVPIPTCQVIGSSVTAMPFDAQMDIIVSWAKSRLSKMVCVANAHMLVEAHWNEAFAAVLKEADLVTSDGMPIVWMMKLLGVRAQNRVAGMEILLALCHLSLQSDLKIFFLGCERSTLDRMQKRLDIDFPGLKVVGMEPLPFRPMTAAEEEEVLDMIEASGANLVFVSLGCPKQEYWMNKHRDHVQAVMLGLGGAFPVYAGVKKWAPPWIRAAGLEWLYRLLQEPRRLAGRYGKTNQVFLWLAFKQFLRIGFEQFSGQKGSRSPLLPFVNFVMFLMKLIDEALFSGPSPNDSPSFPQSPTVASPEQQVAAALLGEGSVEDCAVVSRLTLEGDRVQIAYVVCSTSFCAERIQTHLNSVLPAAAHPAAYVSLSRLPLTPAGQVDEQALSRLAVLDDAVIHQWESSLKAQTALEQVAVVRQHSTHPGNAASLHLSDLLPHWQRAAADSTPLAVAAQEWIAAQESSSQVPALCGGGTLPQDPEAPATLLGILVRAASQIESDRIVYLQPDGSVQAQSYADLLREAEQILGGLRQCGLVPQDKVIFQLERSQDILPAFWGCILGGFIPVIMGTAPTYRDVNSAVDKLFKVWTLLDRPLILGTAALQEPLRQLSVTLSLPDLKTCAIETLRHSPPDADHHPSQPQDPAFFNLTSGSTGTPKCISLTHWNLIARARGTNLLNRHTPENIILNWLPFDHIGSISDWHVRCVDLGCHMVYGAKDYVLGRPLNWLDLIHRYRISHSWAPNFAYALVNDALKQESAPQSWDLSCVQSLLTAGEAVSSSAVTDFIDNLAAYGFKQTAIRPAFGMAEMGSGITYFQPTAAEPMRSHRVEQTTFGIPIRRVSPDRPNCITFADLGPPIPGITIRIVDRESLVLPEETIGFLQVKGDAVSLGYYNNPAVNVEVFLADGWFNTGDLGFIADGQLVITGRAKETIIINGANYYNHEIEAAVEEIEGVEVSYTAACAIRDGNSATEKLAIFFHTPLTEAEDHTEALIALLKTIRQTVVSKIGLNPDFLIPVPQEAIPKTGIGKIQRSQLSQQFTAGTFDPILKDIDLLLTVRSFLSEVVTLG